MKKDHILIPEPSSKFLKISCKECEEVQVVFSHATLSVRCDTCGNVLTKSTGSKALMHGRVVGSTE